MKQAPAWDWEHPYQGAPGVAVKGFPRPLYPPGAPGYPPSVAGSDVEAYKRTISRLGRWPWQPYDQAFNVAFSQGKPPGNVSDSGVAGFQRQQGIDDSGYIGEKTFGALRCALVPDGLPHAGEHGMDARSVELINAAYDRFQGQPEPPDTGLAGSSAQGRLVKAETQIGNCESPANSNMQKYGDWYGMNGQPWCAIFASWCDQTSDTPSKSLLRSVRYHYVPTIVSDARMGYNGLTVTSSPQPGDLVCYDWSFDGEYDHVGIVDEPPDTGGAFTAIEGNTSTSDNSNGGQVMRRTRSMYSQATVFVRIREP